MYSKEALNAHRSTLGSDHPLTIVSLNNVGVVLKAQGLMQSRNVGSLEWIFLMYIVIFIYYYFYNRKL